MARAEGFRYRPALDGLRAVAVAVVVAYHLGPGSPDLVAGPGASGRGGMHGGFLGVDLFFVLSGYLITSLLLVERRAQGRIALSAFWVRRARRLLPAVLLLLFAVALYARFWAPSDRLATLRGDALATLAYVANWRFIWSGQSYFDAFGAETSPLRHMWSLAIEEQFYLLWPLVVATAIALGRGRWRVLFAVVAVGAAASTIAMAALYDPLEVSRAYFGTGARAHSLFVGAGLALLLARWRPERPASARALQGAGVVAAVAVVWAFLVVDAEGAWYYRGGSLAFAVACAVVIAAVVQDGRTALGPVLTPAPLRWLGLVSYGVYLWHWPAIVWLNRGRTGLDGLTLDVVRVGATLAVASLSFYLLERPIRYGRIAPRRVALAVPASMVLMGLVIVGATTGATTNPLAETTPITAPPPPSPGRPGEGGDGAVRSVAMVGDSVAVTVGWGLEGVAAGEGIRFVSTAFPGCSVAAGVLLDDQGRRQRESDPCLENVPGVHERMVAEHEPDVVLWLSTWELSDREEDGEHLVFGTPAHDRALLAEMQVAHDRLTAGRARVVLLVPAPAAAGDTSGPQTDTADLDHYRALLEELAARNPDSVAVVDLAEVLCPDGVPCPERIDGVRVRGTDGRHLTEDTSPWLAERLLPLVLDAVHATAPGA